MKFLRPSEKSPSKQDESLNLCPPYHGLFLELASAPLSGVIIGVVSFRLHIIIPNDVSEQELFSRIYTELM